MFGRKKLPKEEPQKSTLDKVIMGAIIGTAIGSVIGLTVAPKKGDETRSELGTLTKETVSGLGALLKKFMSSRQHKDVKKVPLEAREEKTMESHSD